MLGIGHGGLYKAPTRGDSERQGREVGKINGIDFRVQEWETLGFGNGKRKQDVL